MDQSKLFKALERNKAQREGQVAPSLEPVTKPEDLLQAALVKEKPASEAQVITELHSTETLFSKTGSVKNIRNPSPMAISDMKRNKLVYSGMKNRAVLNAYRELRIKLTDNSDATNLTVMISSVDTGDNSILTAMNLAISFALDQSVSALLVDCNPYGSELQSLVTATLGDGITDYILGEVQTLENIIYPSGIDRVNVIPAGNNPSSAVELFSSQDMQNLVYELKNRYPDRFIVINAPPVLASSEARVLNKYCDHSVLTLPYGTSSVDSVEDAIAAIGPGNVSGVVYQQ